MARINQPRDRRNNNLDKVAESIKQSTVYSTKRINEILEDKKRGMTPDLNPFWHGDEKYRDTGVIFEYTTEELEELDKCAMDNIYFVENYCTFKNDNGRTKVKLRDYQTRVLKLFGEEVWNPTAQVITPKNRFIALMQSRLTGKCVTMDTDVNLLDVDANAIKKINNQKYSFWHFLKRLFV